MFCRDFVDDSDTMIIDKKRFEKMTMPRCDIEELKQKIKGMRVVLQDCKQMFVAEKSFLVQCSRLEDIESIIERIDEVLNDKN